METLRDWRPQGKELGGDIGQDGRRGTRVPLHTEYQSGAVALEIFQHLDHVSGALYQDCTSAPRCN